jgi:hypothetical protein
MTDQHPITLPLELVQQWARENFGTHHLCTRAARWGADQELEACLERILDVALADQLRAARRPKPPTLKEQALADLDSMSIEPCLVNGIDVNAPVRAKYDNIRRALEALPND